MAQFFSGMGSGLLTDVASALVYAAIAALFIICMIKCVLPVNRSKRVLRRAARVIRQGDKADKSWQEDTFLGKGALYPHWSEYLNNLFFADGVFHNPANVEDYINEDSAVYGPGRVQFASAAPGIMVSLGFLGTLIGISQGLQGFNMDDAEKVMAAIRQLIPGMQYAFMTSIVGVVASVLTTLVTGIANGAAFRALDGFYSAMRRYAGVQSVDPMTQIAIYQQEQTALIQGMAKDLSGTMTERMAEAMGTAIGKSISSLQTSLDDFAANVTREQLRGVDAIVQRFLAQMNAALDGQFDQLKHNLEDTNRNQRQMNENVRQSMEGLNQVSKNILSVAQISDSLLAKYDGCMARLNATAQLAQDGYGRMAANAEHLEVVARQFNGYLQSVSKLQNELLKTVDDFGANAERFLNMLNDAAGGAGHALMDAADELKKSGDTLAANHKLLVGGISKDIDRSYNTFFKSTNDTIEHMGWTVDDVKNTLATLPDTLERASGLYARQAERLVEALRAAQTALVEAVDSLSANIYGAGGPQR